MTAIQTQLQACSHCDSLKFGIVRELRIEMLNEAKPTRGNPFLVPRFDVVVCLGCGLTRMFARKDKHYLLHTCEHEIIDVSSPNPYR